MFYRAIGRALNWTIAPHQSLVRVISRKQLIRNSTTLRKHAAVVVKSGKLRHFSCHHDPHHMPEPNISSISNVFCEELGSEIIGQYVQVRGVVMHIKKGDYIVLRDKTGSVRLVFPKSRKDLMEWQKKLEKYSHIKIIGIVKEKGKEKSTVDVVDENNMKAVDVVINYVLSTTPFSAIEKTGKAQGEKEKVKVTARNSHSTLVTCDKISEKDIGKTVQLFGWVDSTDIGKKSFVLGDAHASIEVVPEDGEGVFHGVEELIDGDVIVVEGVVTKSAMQIQNLSKSFTNQELDDSELHISANFVKKLNEENCLGLKAPDINSYTMRSHNCGQLNASYVGQTVRLMGWVVFSRMNTFIVLQDKYGLVQLNFSRINEVAATSPTNIPLESVISVTGIVDFRPPGNENKLMKSGEIEVTVTDCEIINMAGVLPFYQKDVRPSRPSQLEYRYLDLRQYKPSRMHLEFRCQILHKMRRFLIEKVGFLEIETPTLFRRTPGGAQEFVVPTSKKGEFYALVQSPQQFKQLLMIAGLDKYFQIARCYRDEVSKKDRQPEFTQLDLEMSFCDREGVIKLIEDIVKFVWPEDLQPIKFPFPRITYDEAMALYGTDKPDTRFEWKINDLTDIFKKAGPSCSERVDMNQHMSLPDFSAFSLVVKKGVKAFITIKQLAEELAMAESCKMFSFKLNTMNKLDDSLNNLFKQPIPEAIKGSIKYDVGDVVFLSFGSRRNLLKLFAALRKTSAKIVEEHGINVFQKSQPFSFLWVVDFPLFEEVDGVIQSVHHPFTQPHPDDVQLLKTNPLKVRGLHYDLVVNGNEIGGGSIRIHDSKLQENVLCDVLKLDKAYFQHLLDALSYGAPIHGGFALGIDRFISILRNTVSIMDVIAFPKYSTGRDPISGAPCDIPKADKDLYHLQ